MVLDMTPIQHNLRDDLIKKCDQLFHLISGYAIAKSIGRVHYLPYEKEHMEVVLKYLELFKRVFPALERTYILGQIGINATVCHSLTILVVLVIILN
ncbi:hypothetical protein COOONC_02887, partial [Cooperia oncophora]